MTDCHITKQAITAIPTPIAAQIQGAQLWACPSCRPKTIRNNPTADSATPSRSTCLLWVGSDGTSRSASTRPTTPTGTLTKKIHCQPRWSTSTPPASGPTSVATPAVAPHTLIATPRRSAGNVRVITDNVCGVSSAAPTPCSTRAATSIPMLPDSPHHSEASVNTDNPTR